MELTGASQTSEHAKAIHSYVAFDKERVKIVDE